MYTVCDVCYCVCLMGLVCVCTCGQVCMYTRIFVSYGCGMYYAADVGYFKQALVTPLIKKKTLCRNEFKNYRPISNLSFLSKILEKFVAKRLNAHIEEHLLSNHVQSAYKRFHSTETALLKIHNDIICNMDNGKVTALTLLDLSAAFDTIDNATLLERLCTWTFWHFWYSFSMVQIIHFKQTATRSHRWVTFMPTRS